VDEIEPHRRLLTVRESLGLANISGGIAPGVRENSLSGDLLIDL